MGLITKEDALQAGVMMYKQHNAITSGRYDFSACQLDVVFMLLSSLQEGQLTYQIHTSDIELITGRKWNIAQFKDSTEQLLTRMFEVDTDDDYTQFVLFQYFKYFKGTRTIEVKLSEIALPYFFDLKNNFTYFQLKSVLNCTSSYAKRLYMLACQWRTVGKFPKPVPIIELKRMLGLVDKKGNEQLERISQFKERVLDIAKKQINEHTDINFDYQLYKKGRSFEYIQIFVDTSKTNPKQLEIDFSNDLTHQKNVRIIESYGISHEYAELIVKDGYDKFIKFVADINDKAKKGKISVDNAPAYIIGTYQKKGVLPKK
ncbi:replication initiation protein [Sphingobacterium sp. MYb388]|uniref:replication initiation protein n=1 Tax=Sphingobacterium sp. MYb388 TaxID=2745437 RepID=UPI0030AC70C4